MKTNNEKLMHLKKPEFANLALKVNNNCVAVDYFRKNLFNATVRDSIILKRKKIIYDDGITTIKTDRSLNQTHRDLLSLLMYEKKTEIQPDGSFYIKTKLYQLAKKMGYKTPNKAINRVFEKIEDMSRTFIYYDQDTVRGYHSLLGSAYYDREEDNFVVKIPAETSKYLIYSVGASIPQELNQKIVNLKNAQLKALISFLLSNKKLKNGIGFDVICEKIEIKNNSKSRAKSKFKKIINENISTLADFDILYENDKFFLKKMSVKFYHALTNKELDINEKNEIDKNKPDIIGSSVKISIKNIFGKDELEDYTIFDVVLEKDTMLWKPIAKDINNNKISLNPRSREELEKKFGK